MQAIGLTRRDVARLKRLAETTDDQNVPAGLSDLDVTYRIQALPESMAARTAPLSDA